MKIREKSLWFKIVGWAVFIHIILIALSILEVFIYSAIINPGQEQSFYDAHAMESAPVISVVFGIICFFFTTRFLAGKQPKKRLAVALALPIAYIVMDLIMLIPYGINCGEQYFVFILSFGSKILAAFAGAMTIRKT